MGRTRRRKEDSKRPAKKPEPSSSSESYDESTSGYDSYDESGYSSYDDSTTRTTTTATTTTTTTTVTTSPTKNKGKRTISAKDNVTKATAAFVDGKTRLSSGDAKLDGPGDVKFYEQLYQKRSLIDHLQFSRTLICDKMKPNFSKNLFYKVLQIVKIHLANADVEKDLDADFEYKDDIPEYYKIMQSVYLLDFYFLPKACQEYSKMMEKSMKECMAHYKGTILNRKRREIIHDIVEAMKKELRDNKETAIEEKDEKLMEMHVRMEKQAVQLSQFRDSFIQNSVNRGDVLLHTHMELLMQIHYLLSFAKHVRDFFTAFVKELIAHHEECKNDEDRVVKCYSMEKGIRDIKVLRFDNDTLKQIMNQVKAKDSVVHRIEGTDRLSCRKHLKEQPNKVYAPSKLTYKVLYAKIANEAETEMKEDYCKKYNKNIKEVDGDRCLTLYVSEELSKLPALNTPEVSYVYQKKTREKEKAVLAEAENKEPARAADVRSASSPRKEKNTGQLPVHLYKKPEKMVMPDLESKRWTLSFRRRHRKEFPPPHELWGNVGEERLPDGKRSNLLTRAPTVDSPVWEDLAEPSPRKRGKDRDGKREEKGDIVDWRCVCTFFCN
ncbi:hypothetical protein ADEAN_000103100 [Angomonas deanei]|uniref:Uncharacterized protein n=1 Tax=Angomonas deanei TaxID=59799 RepID=A0A7G2C1E7_9TRYP|nr:hypothetical protein ADEAN_000103100 [Angomonas deanei]